MHTLEVSGNNLPSPNYFMCTMLSQAIEMLFLLVLVATFRKLIDERRIRNPPCLLKRSVPSFFYLFIFPSPNQRKLVETSFREMPVVE